MNAMETTRRSKGGRLLERAFDGSNRLAGIVSSVAVVAFATGVIALLDRWIPVLSLGVLYVAAVLPVAVFWGLAYAVAVSIGSMLAFNFFFLEPVHTFTLADSRNWFALLVFVVTSVVVSGLAARSRRRALESALLTEIATSLLEHGTVAAELDRISTDAARALHAERARIVLGAEADGGYELTAGGRKVGAITLEGGMADASSRRRVLPALASLLGVAVDRERLAAEALEAEALRRADAIKTAVLRAVSHDLRTPLMAISTSASTLASPQVTIDESDRAELLSTIVTASAQLDRLVGNLLDLSRLQAGEARPERRLVEVEELVAGALAELGDDGRRVEVSAPDEGTEVVVDAHQAQHVLTNLIENALKYSSSDEPVRVQIAGTQSEAVIRVIDHGPGISPAERELIFEPFHRGRRAAGQPGAGLGLAIARGFTEANGGRLTVESRQSQGATFVLSFPRAVGAAVEAAR
jgi:two-component system, OmpR family, sensor histidine kinase KdpD